MPESSAVRACRSVLVAVVALVAGACSSSSSGSTPIAASCDHPQSSVEPGHFSADLLASPSPFLSVDLRRSDKAFQITFHDPAPIRGELSSPGVLAWHVDLGGNPGNLYRVEAALQEDPTGA